MCILAVVIIVFFTYAKVFALDNMYDPWIPMSSNRTDLRCPLKQCTPDPVNDHWTQHSCCVCSAKPSWDLDGSFKLLAVEYIKRNGSASVVGDFTGHLKLIHEYGFLNELPYNLCNFVDIVEIKLQHNNIQAIGNLQCLVKLDTLDLSYNLIKHVSRGTFNGLKNLRVIKITNNLLKWIDAYSLSGNNYIFDIDLSFNKIQKMEYSNLLPNHNFCVYNFSFNKINEIVNNAGFRVNTSENYYGGFVDFDSNSFTRFIDFTKLGIDDVLVLGRILDFGFSFRNNSWVCDCQMEPYLEMAKQHLNNIWRDHFNWTCGSPPEFRGYSIPEYFVYGDRLDQLICNITYFEKCPRGCTCFDQPRYNKTVVDCTTAGLYKTLPKRMPDNANLTLIFRNNTIKTLDNREYFNRTFSLDLSHNGLKEINYGAFLKPVELNLSGNNITGLPRDFGMFTPCSIMLGTVFFQCDCSDLWLRDWTVNNKMDECKNITDIYCITPAGAILSSLLLQKGDLCAVEAGNLDVFYILIGTVVVLLLGLFSIYVTFRFEFYILRRKYMCFGISNIVPLFEHDVFVSFDENDDAVRMWVILTLRTFLFKYGYKCYIPCIDDVMGDIRIEGLASSINTCKHYIVIVSEKYLIQEDNWSNIEWKYIWNSFKQNKERKVIVINFDHVTSCQIIDSKLRAFVRLGQDTDFSNRKHDLYKNIKNELGDPVYKKVYL